MKIGSHETHPAADIFPLLDGPELSELVEDVRRHGLRLPVVLHEGKVLDGRNRVIACERASVEPRFETFTGDDPVAFVVSQNLRRRHLNESQRALAASRLKEFLEAAAHERQVSTLKRGKASPRSCQLAGTGAEAAEQAAKTLNTSARSVYRAERVLKKGAPELVRAVEQGDVAVSTAEVLTQLEPEAQVATVAKGKHAAASKAKELRAKPPAPVAATPKVRVRAAMAGASFSDLVEAPEGKYRCIFAAPPFKESYGKAHAAASMSEDELAALDVRRLAHGRGCHLWLKTPWSMIREGVVHRLLERWGFRWAAEVVCHTGLQGPGRWLRPVTEILILAVYGPLEALVEREAAFLEVAGRDVVADMHAFVERCTSGPRIELFATEAAPGWDACAIEPKGLISTEGSNGTDW